MSALPKGCSVSAFTGNTGLGRSVERQHCVLSALGGGTEKRRRNLKAGRAVSSAAFLGSMRRSSSAADGKQCNWQSMHKTSAAIRVVSGFKSKTYKKPEPLDTKLHGTPAQPRLFPDPPYPAEGVFNLLPEQQHQQLVSCCGMGLSVLGTGRTAAWGSTEHPNFSG